MTHQPPIPVASTSPYPLHLEPIHHDQSDFAIAKHPHTDDADDTDDGRAPLGRGTIVGAAIGIGSAAIVAALLYARRDGKTGKGDGHNGSGDDKNERGEVDRVRVSAKEPYEVTYFARKHGITAAEARDIIARAGPDRKAANALAQRRAK